MDHAVHQELVAQDTVQVEQIEDQLAGSRVIDLIGEGQRNIKLRIAGQMEAGGLVARIKLIEQQMEPEQALVGVLRGKVHAVVVIPERAQRFVDVASGCVVRVEPGQDFRIVLIAEVSSRVEIAGVAVTFRRRVPVVQVGGHGRKSKAGIVYLVHRGQAVDVARHLGHAVVGLVGRAGAADRVNMVTEAPDGLRWQVLVTRLAGRKLLLSELVNPGWREREAQGRGLVTSRANLCAISSTARVRADRGRGAQRRDRHRGCGRHDGERINKWRRRWARRLVTGDTQVERPRTLITP